MTMVNEVEIRLVRFQKAAIRNADAQATLDLNVDTKLPRGAFLRRSFRWAAIAVMRSLVRREGTALERAESGYFSARMVSLAEPRDTPAVPTTQNSLQDENRALRMLVTDLLYSGVERGYVRRSELWGDQVRKSARAAGLSEREADILIDADDT